jgi:hypothetical protein
MIIRNGIALGLLAACAHMAHAEPLGIKLGAWEMTYTSQISGDTIPQAMLDKMSPEQRARHEERMKKRAAAGPSKRTETTCVKKENLERDAFGSREQKDCTYKNTSQTRSLHAGIYECTGSMARKGEMRYEAIGSDKVKGMVKMTSARGSMEMQLEGKWVGPVCNKDND